jgi:hypothetical protein
LIFEYANRGLDAVDGGNAKLALEVVAQRGHACAPEKDRGGARLHQRACGTENARARPRIGMLQGKLATRS